MPLSIENPEEQDQERSAEWVKDKKPSLKHGSISRGQMQVSHTVVFP